MIPNPKIIQSYSNHCIIETSHNARYGIQVEFPFLHALSSEFCTGEAPSALVLYFYPFFCQFFANYRVKPFDPDSDYLASPDESEFPEGQVILTHQPTHSFLFAILRACTGGVIVIV